jgi:hypothetical protein
MLPQCCFNLTRPILSIPLTILGTVFVYPPYRIILPQFTLHTSTMRLALCTTRHLFVCSIGICWNILFQPTGVPSLMRDALALVVSRLYMDDI